MHLLTQLKRKFLVSTPVSFLIRRSKKILLPGFQGIPLFDVVRFFFLQAQKTGFTERASAIAFNFTMTIPPAIIFLFTLVPYLPISQAFVNQMFSLIKDVMPGERNNGGLIKFLSDILNKPRTGLLSTGFLLAMFFSSNAVMGIMRSFDRNYIGFTKRKDLHERFVALRLTFILFILFFISMLTLIMQESVLRWLGITNTTLISLIHNLRWVVTILMFFFAISFIYRYAPSIHKRWKLVNPGSILATFLMIIFTAGFSWWVSNFSNYNELYGSMLTLTIVREIINNLSHLFFSPEWNLTKSRRMPLSFFSFTSFSLLSS